MKLGVGLTVAFLISSSTAQAGVDERLALTGDPSSLAGQFLAEVGVVLEFDARVLADGSLDVVVTHDLAEVAGAMTEGSALVTRLAGVRLEEALAVPELGQRVQAVLDSKIWDAYCELVRVLRNKIGREPAHAKLVLALAQAVESGDRFRAGAYRVPALARMPAK
jgi:hypothetical protein